MTTALRLPTIPQCAVRAHGGHRNALRRIQAGETLLRPGAYASEVRGMRTVLQTLTRWACVESSGETLRLTRRGAELLAAIDARLAP